MLKKALPLVSILLFTGCVERGFELTVNDTTNTITAIKSVDIRKQNTNNTKKEIDKMNQAVNKASIQQSQKVSVKEEKLNQEKKEKELQALKEEKHKAEAEKLARQKREKEAKAELERKLAEEKALQEKKEAEAKAALERKLEKERQLALEKQKAQEAAKARKLAEEKKLKELQALKEEEKRKAEAEKLARLKREKEVKAELELKLAEEKALQQKKEAEAKAALERKLEKERQLALEKQKAQEAAKARKLAEEKKAQELKKREAEAKLQHEREIAAQKIQSERTKSIHTAQTLNFMPSAQTYQKFGTSEIHGHVVYLTSAGKEINLKNTKIYLVPQNTTTDYWYNNYYLRNKESASITENTVHYINATHLNLEKNFAFYGLAKGTYYVIVESDYPSYMAKNKKVYIAKKIDVEKYKKIMTVFAKKL